jgi:hypothetical protein
LFGLIVVVILFVVIFFGHRLICIAALAWHILVRPILPWLCPTGIYLPLVRPTLTWVSLTGVALLGIILSTLAGIALTKSLIVTHHVTSRLYARRRMRRVLSTTRLRSPQRTRFCFAQATSLTEVAVGTASRSSWPRGRRRLGVLRVSPEMGRVVQNHIQQ